MSNTPIRFVVEFRYLGHTLNNKFTDDDDIKCEIRNLLVRTNLLARRFGKCSIVAKLLLLKSYCLCLYDASVLWTFASSSMDKLKSCYNK